MRTLIILAAAGLASCQPLTPSSNPLDRSEIITRGLGPRCAAGSGSASPSSPQFLPGLDPIAAPMLGGAGSSICP
jgi:hypothetical protein